MLYLVNTLLQKYNKNPVIYAKTTKTIGFLDSYVIFGQYSAAEIQQKSYFYARMSETIGILDIYVIFGQYLCTEIQEISYFLCLND